MTSASNSRGCPTGWFECAISPAPVVSRCAAASACPVERREAVSRKEPARLRVGALVALAARAFADARLSLVRIGPYYWRPMSRRLRPLPLAIDTEHSAGISLPRSDLMPASASPAHYTLWRLRPQLPTTPGAPTPSRRRSRHKSATRMNRERSRPTRRSVPWGKP